MDADIAAGDAVATAIAHAAWRQGLLGDEEREELRAELLAHGCRDLEGVRRHLGSGSNIARAIATDLFLLIDEIRPRRAGDWQCVARVGRSSTFQALLAVHADGRLALAKRVPAHLLRIPEFRARLHAVAELDRRLDAAGIELPRLLDLVEVENGGAFLCFAYLPWPSWADAMPPGGMPAAALVAIADGILEQLAAIHALGLLHRKVRPHNCFLATGRGRLGSSGLVRPIGPALAPLELEGQLQGDPHYLAPELITAPASADGRADCYALGCCLYHALHGQPPFTGTTSEVLRAQLEQDLPASERIDAAGPLAAVLRRATAKDPAARYPDAAAMRAALHAAP